MFLEARAIQPKITSLALENTIFERADNKSDTLQLVYLEFSRRLTANEANQLRTWVEARLKTNKFKLIAEPDLP
jgi:hypothetical protein